MIKLTLNGQPVALFPDTKIGVTANNPYFNEIGAFSYPFTIPYIPNQGILKHAARIQNVTRTFIWDAVLLVDGVELLRGEAIAEGDVIDNAFPIVLRSAQTSFVKMSETKKMQDLDWGGDPGQVGWDEDLARRAYALSVCYPNYPYVCAPFYNASELTPRESYNNSPNYINKYDPGTGMMADFNSEGKSPVVTYSFYVRYLLKRIIEIFGYTLTVDDVDTMPDLNRWFLLSLNFLGGSKVYRYAMPQIVVRDFLKTLRQFGIAVIVDERRGTASIKLVRDIIRSAPVSNLLNKKALVEIPVMTTPKDGYVIGYKDGGDDFITQTIADDAAIQPVANFAALPAPSGVYSSGIIYKTASTGKHYCTVLQKKADDTDPDVWLWQETGLCREITSGAGEEKVEINITVIGQRWETNSVTKTQVIPNNGNPISITKTWNIDIEMPTIDQKINSTFIFGSAAGKYEEPPLVFLFNWGMKSHFCPADNRVFVDTPVISSDAYGRDETEKGALSMRTYGAKSIIEQLVRDEQDWIMRRKQKRQSFILSVLDYANFNWGEIQNISSVNYLVNSLKFDIGKNGISPVEADLYTA